MFEMTALGWNTLPYTVAHNGSVFQSMTYGPFDTLRYHVWHEVKKAIPKWV